MVFFKGNFKKFGDFVGFYRVFAVSAYLTFCVFLCVFMLCAADTFQNVCRFKTQHCKGHSVVPPRLNSL